MIRFALRSLTVLALAGLTLTVAEPLSGADGAPEPASTPRCSAPAPTTAEGYERLWASLPADEWGAADLSISVPLPDGRVLWLYGDTFSTGRFVHSSAIVQDGGCLHVSRGGEQVIPNVRDDLIFWIESAEATSDSVLIRARAIEIVDPTDPWGFRDAGFSTMWRTTVNDAGDLVGLDDATGYEEFASTTPLGGRIDSPAPDPGPMYPLDDEPHHFGYAKHSHPWAALDSGKTLTTTAQNWDDGVLHPLEDYRPIWSEE